MLRLKGTRRYAVGAMAPSRNEQDVDRTDKQAAQKAERETLPHDAAPDQHDTPDTSESRLYFFPDESIDETRARALLAHGTPKERAWVVSHLLRYAQWDDIWDYIEREEVCEIFDSIDLPDSLRSAWARMLKIEAPVA